MSDIKGILADDKGWKKLLMACFDFFKLTRQEEMYQQAGNTRMPNFLISESSTVLSAISKMASTGSHQVWICDSTNAIVGQVGLQDLMAVLTSNSV